MRALIPEVSVVMGVYNGEQYLHASIESILLQKDVDFEFIIVDDGSTDSTAVILEEFSKRDPRIRIISQENQGLTLALIRGCSEARARYIARQDADDISMSGRLETLAQMLREDSSLVFVSSWAQSIGPSGELLHQYERPSSPDAATRQLLFDRIGPPGHGSVMFRRDMYEKVGGYRSKFYYAQDSDLWLRMGLVGRLGYAQRVLYRYRIEAGSISGARHYEKLAYSRLISELHMARMAGEDEGRIWDRAKELLYIPHVEKRKSEDLTLYFIGRSLVSQRDPRAIKYLAKSIMANPARLKAWLLFAGALPYLFWRRIPSIPTEEKFFD